MDGIFFLIMAGVVLLLLVAHGYLLHRINDFHKKLKVAVGDLQENQIRETNLRREDGRLLRDYCDHTENKLVLLMKELKYEYRLSEKLPARVVKITPVRGR